MKGTISRVLGKLRPKARSQLDTEAAAQFAILAQVKVQKPGQPSPDPEVALERPGSEGRPQRGSATLMLPSSGEPSRPTSPEERPTGDARRATPDFLPAPRTVTDPQVDLKERKVSVLPSEAPAPQVKMREKKKVVFPPPDIETSAHEEPKASSPKTQIHTKKFGFKAGINRLSSLFQRKGSSESASAVYLPDASDNAASSRQSVMFPESFDSNTPKVPRKQQSTTPVAQRKQELSTTPVAQRKQELSTAPQPGTILSPVSPSSVPMFKGTSTPPHTKPSIYVDSPAQPEWSTVWAAPRNATEEQDRIRRRGEDLLQAIQALESTPLSTPVRAAEVARLPNPFNEQVNPLFDVSSESAPIRIKPPAGTFLLDSDEHTSC